MISNWIVKTKQIKNKLTGFINHANYLHDEDRIAHRNTRILVINEARDNILKEHNKRTEFRRKNALRGGGVRNYATSFVLSLPRDIKQPSKNEWEKISLFALKKVSESTLVPFETLKALSHIVLHDESTTLDKNSHVHILISNVINNEVCKELTQKKTTYAVKKSFNYSVKKLLKVDNVHYSPKNKNVKDKPLHIARLEKAESTLASYNRLNKVISIWINSLKIQHAKLLRYLSAKSVSKEFSIFESIVEQELTSSVDEVFDFICEVEDSLRSSVKDDNKDESPVEVLDYNIKQNTKRKRRRRIQK